MQSSRHGCHYRVEVGSQRAEDETGDDQVHGRIVAFCRSPHLGPLPAGEEGAEERFLSTFLFLRGGVAFCRSPHLGPLPSGGRG